MFRKHASFIHAIFDRLPSYSGVYMYITNITAPRAKPTWITEDTSLPI